VTVDDVPRVQRIKEYVLARLGEELAGAPRGAQAQLAKKLGVSGAHLSNMLSRSPTRQPGEDFRRKAAAHWGLSYGQLEAAALGEDAPPESTMKPSVRGEEATDAPSLTAALAGYAWMPELPLALRKVVEEQARQHLPFGGFDYSQDDWQRIVTGLEREALALLARRPSHVSGLMARVVDPTASPKKPAREG
jgi:transcriptional regulator with XRE-family HTH domain